MHGKHATEADDLENALDPVVATDDEQVAVVLAQPLGAADQHAERRRIEEGHRGEGDDDMTGALVDASYELLVELGGSAEVDLARECHHRNLVCGSRQLRAKR